MSDSLRPCDGSPPGSSIHGIFQARILEWIAISFSRGSSLPRDRTQMSSVVDRHYHLSHREGQSTNWRTTVSGGGTGQLWPAVGSGTLTAAVMGSTVCWLKSFGRRPPLPLSKFATRQNTTPPISRKLDLKFTEHSPTHQSKTQFSPWPVPPIRKLIQDSYPHPSEGRQNENHNHRKLTKLITWITTLCGLKKL